MEKKINLTTLPKQVLSGTLLWWEMKKATQKCNWSRMSPWEGNQHLQGKGDQSSQPKNYKSNRKIKITQWGGLSWAHRRNFINTAEGKRNKQRLQVTALSVQKSKELTRKAKHKPPHRKAAAQLAAKGVNDNTASFQQLLQSCKAKIICFSVL